jgi:hypothetical protein
MAGGASIVEGIDGRYLSVIHNATIYERVSLVYSDFPTDWSNDLERSEVTDYLEDLKNFAEAVLWQEETILVATYAVFHISSQAVPVKTKIQRPILFQAK